MTNINHTSTSTDIAMHTRAQIARDAGGHSPEWDAPPSADPFLYMPRKPRGYAVLWAALAGVVIVAAIVWGLA
jgi:hypothetical protein